MTFSNTLKYVFLATSANFGNMFSMMGASLFLPFLPLLPKQILFMNLLTDLPEMAISGDTVDHELADAPHRWNVSFIHRFMIALGLLSSVFDYLTFGLLAWLWNADAPLFRIGWFIESTISAATIVLVVRSRRPFFRSRPSPALLLATLSVAAIAIMLPMTRIGQELGFTPPPPSLVISLSALVALYVLAAEILKRAFYARMKF